MIDLILKQLRNVKQKKNHYICQCPVCGDDHHLYVTPNGDKLPLFYCQKCKAGWDDIKKYIELPKTTPPTTNEIIEEYDHIYKNPDGTIAYKKKRIKYSNGKKKFNFYHEIDGKVVWKKPANSNYLYNLDLLEQATPETTLYIVEGEKCADIMVKYGFLATTTNTGAGSKFKLSKVDTSYYNKFSKKIVIPDNDEAGVNYAKNFPEATILLLTDICENIKPKYDIYDYIVNGGDLELIKSYQPKEITPFCEMDTDELLHDSTFSRIINIKNSYERTKAEQECTERAKELKCTTRFRSLLKAYKTSIIERYGAKEGNVTNFTGQPIQLSCDKWTANDSGVFVSEFSFSTGEVVDKYASPIPILPTEILYNIDTGTEKMKIEFFKKKWSYLIIERSTVASSTKIIELANKGVEVNSENSRLLVKYLADCVSNNLDVIPINKSVSRLGWVKDSFIPLDKSIKFDGENEYKYLYEAVSSKGDIAKWMKIVKPLRDKIEIRLAMAASVASVFLEPLNLLPFVFHLWGMTGSGKTVALMVAASIWGDPSMGKLVRTMNMTTNAMMNTAAFLRNLPFFGDELQTIKSKWENYDSLIMNVCEGSDRGRMSYDKLNESKSWKCSFLFTGEEPCVKPSSGGGVLNRVIQVHCNDDLITNGNEVVNVICNNYGVAAPFIINVVKTIINIGDETFQKRYQKYLKKVMESSDTSEKQASSLAIIMVADVLIDTLFFKSGIELKVDELIQYLFTNDEIDTARRAYDYMMDLIAINATKFDPSSSSNEIWGKRTPEHIYFINSVLRKELDSVGFDLDAVKERWAEDGLIEKEDDKRYVTRARISKNLVYCIKIIINSGEDDDEIDDIPFTNDFTKVKEN